MALECHIRPDLASTGQSESLLGAGLRFQLGHFEFLRKNRPTQEWLGMPRWTAHEARVIAPKPPERKGLG